MNKTEYTLLLNGDRMAQHRFYDALAPQMLSICCRYINNRQDAESVMIDGFFKVFTTIDQLQKIESIEAWTRRIMVRESLQFLRKQKEISFLGEETINPIYQEEIEDEVSNLTQEELLTLICELPTKARTVFNLFILDEYSHKEIAKELGISEATSKSHLKWARKGLQDKISSISKVFRNERA